ncbi:MAG: HD domain-containing protein [Flavisolibacter sp.]
MQAEFQIWKERVLQMLALYSDPQLAYHNVCHTEDVLLTCEKLAREEGITGQHALLLLKLAALFHDTGFLIQYKGHEEKSCEIARRELAGSRLSEGDLDTICSTIMATKIPQSPKNHMEEIICDADLDYLGREDFELISDRLRKEYFVLGMVQTEKDWMQLQIRFIEGHEYFTKTSRKQRGPQKLKHLEQLRNRAVLNITNTGI